MRYIRDNVADVVRGTILAMEAGSGTYNVGGGEEATMRDTIAIFEELAGRPLEIRDHPAVPGDQPAAAGFSLAQVAFEFGTGSPQL